MEYSGSPKKKMATSFSIFEDADAASGGQVCLNPNQCNEHVLTAPSTEPEAQLERVSNAAHDLQAGQPAAPDRLSKGARGHIYLLLRVRH